jgi:hypothetical protein
VTVGVPRQPRRLGRWDSMARGRLSPARRHRSAAGPWANCCPRSYRHRGDDHGAGVAPKGVLMSMVTKGAGGRGLVP